MSYQYNYVVENESQSAEFRLSLYVKKLKDFLIPNYSISVIPSIVVKKPDGNTIIHSTGLTDTIYLPLPDLRNALLFFKSKTYQKYTEEVSNISVAKKIERFDFRVDELGLDISANFLTEQDINKIIADLGQ